MRLGRWLGLVVLPILAGAASPNAPRPAPHTAPLPVPPIPPAQPPTDGPAPVPNRDAAAPTVPQSDDVKVTPRIVRAPSYTEFDQSQGYVSGSRRDEDINDRRLLPSPASNLQVPFK